MKAFQPYLNFDGDTREAMTFYSACVGGVLTMQTFGELDPNTPAESKNRIMHARLEKDSGVIMASDTMVGMPFHRGTNFWINVDCSSIDEQTQMFNALSEGGKVVMPLADQFWGARFGMLQDKFGTSWMLNCDVKK